MEGKPSFAKAMDGKEGKMEGVPFLREGKIVFPEGELTLNKCTLADAEALFGPSSSCSQKHWGKHRLFLHSQGEIVVYFLPEEEIIPQSQAVGLDYVFDKRPRVRNLAEHFGVSDPGKIACVPHCDESFGEEMHRFFAILSLNVFLTGLLPSQLMDRISFIRTDHILNCDCKICKLIRSVCSQRGI